MFDSMNHWHDWWRLVVFLLCVYNIYVLVQFFRKKSKDWNVKTRDLWYSMFMWTVAGVVIGFEGVRTNAGLNFGLPFVTAAILVSLKGLTRKGSWGGRDD